MADAAACLGFPLTAEEADAYTEALVHLDRSLHAAVEGAPAPPVDVPRIVPPEGGTTFAAPAACCFATKVGREPTRRGPLSGLTAAVKENIAVAGLPLRLGCDFLDGILPDRSATVVSRLRSSGARIAGTLTMDPLAVSGDSLGVAPPGTALCANPWSPAHVTGGSSSGAAVAVARRLVDIALGTDQAGSVRLPAAWCGLVGHKPTHGLVPAAGVVGLDPRLDHIGLIGNSVQEVARALGALCRRGRGAPVEAVADGPWEALRLRGVRLGALAEGFEHEGAHPGVLDVAVEALRCSRAVGATIVHVSTPLHPACARLLPCLATAGLWRALTSADELVRRRYATREVAEALAERMRTRADRLPARAKMVLVFGRLAAPRLYEYHRLATSQVKMYRAAYDRLLEQVDCLMMPTTSIPPPVSRPCLDARMRLLLALTRAHLGPLSINTAPCNVTGHPALTLPVGMHQGLPVGLSIVGPRHGDATVCRVARAMQNKLGLSLAAPC